MSPGARGPEPGTGRRLGPLKLVRRVALGATAEVFEAHAVDGIEGTEIAPGRAVAVKRLLPHTLENPERVEGFYHEIRLGLALRHPNVVRVLGGLSLDLGRALVWPLKPALAAAPPPGEPLLVMEYLAGARRAVAGAVAAPPEIVAAVGSGAAAALAAVHALGAVHADVSASNLLLTPDGRVTLVDFGSARFVDGRPPQALVTRGGKTRYASPEQRAGLALSPRSDLYSLGVLLSRLARGSAGASRPQKSELPSGFPAELGALLDACRRAEAAERPEGAAEVARALDRWLAARTDASPQTLLAGWLAGR